MEKLIFFYQFYNYQLLKLFVFHVWEKENRKQDFYQSKLIISLHISVQAWTRYFCKKTSLSSPWHQCLSKGKAAHFSQYSLAWFSKHKMLEQLLASNLLRSSKSATNPLSWIDNFFNDSKWVTKIGTQNIDNTVWVRHNNNFNTPLSRWGN